LTERWTDRAESGALWTLRGSEDCAHQRVKTEKSNKNPLMEQQENSSTYPPPPEFYKLFCKGAKWHPPNYTKGPIVKFGTVQEVGRKEGEVSIET